MDPSLAHRDPPSPPADAGELSIHLSAAIVLFHYAVARRLGLSAADSKALKVVMHHQPVTLSTLARLMHLSPSSTTGLVDRLESAGFVRRQPSSDDRRKIMVVSTGDTHPALSEIFTRLGAAIAELMSRYTFAEQLVIRDYVRRTIEILHEQTENLED